MSGRKRHDLVNERTEIETAQVDGMVRVPFDKDPLDAVDGKKRNLGEGAKEAVSNREIRELLQEIACF